MVTGNAITADGATIGGTDPAVQAREAIRRISVALTGLGAQLDDVVRTRVHLVERAHWAQIEPVHREAFTGTATMVVLVSELSDRALLVEVEADVLLPPGAPASGCPSERWREPRGPDRWAGYRTDMLEA